MAATNYTPIQLYRTTTAAAAPIAGNLNAGEIAINVNDADMALYAKNNTGVVKRLINNPAGLKYPIVDGTANQYIVTNGSGSLLFATPTAAGNPTGTITGAAVNGTATTFMRADAAPALALTFAQLNAVVTDAAVGYLNIPQNSQSAAYTLVLADAGKHILHPASDTNARTFTIPAATSVAYPIGTAITFINLTVAAVSIAITTDTLYLSSAGSTGTRTLAQYGSCTAIKVAGLSSAGIWLISGMGLT